MTLVFTIILMLGTAWLQFNRSIRAGFTPQRALLDALIAGPFIIITWIVWAVRGKPQHQ